jgi:Ca-activated chloride channel family protein
MSFAWPVALAGLAVIPLALVAYVFVQRRRSRYAMRFTNLDLLANVVDASPRWRRHVPPAVFLAALAALVVAVARPQMAMDVPEERATVVLAMDVSTSMEATDVQPSRLVAAQKAAATFLDKVPDELRVGLVTFSGTAQVVVAPTNEHQQVRDALGVLQPDGGTAIGDAIQISSGLGSRTDLAAAGTEKDPVVVLLLSDGEPSPETLDPIQAAQEANDRGVKVFTVALGTDEGTVTLTDEFGNEQVIPVPPDRETLSQVAETTGAQFFDAPTEQALEQVYASLGSKIGTTTEERDVSYLFAAGGAALLLVAGGLSLVWFSRLP